MKKILLFIASLFVTIVACAQMPVFDWAKKFSGAAGAYNEGNSIAIDVAGNVYTTGAFAGTFDFDPGVALSYLTSKGGLNDDIFISKLDASGNFLWAKNIGGNGDDVAYSITVDTAGNIYTTGYFEDTVDFDPGIGIFNLSATIGGNDIFISKLDASGNFVWAKQMKSGVFANQGQSIAIDPLGNILISGLFLGTIVFDTGAGTFSLTAAGSSTDTFISKFDPFGNCIWAKDIGGGASGTYVYSIVFDTSGNVYTTGYFVGMTDFNPGTATFNLSSTGSSGYPDLFVLKLDGAGNFLWAKNMGGSGSSSVYGYAVAVDASGNVYTTGDFQGTDDFDPGTGTFNLNTIGSSDIFISKLNASGNFVWAKDIGGTTSCVGTSIAVDPSGNIYTTGAFTGTVDFDPGGGTVNLISSAYENIFISKLDAAGSFLWAENIGGGSFQDIANSIVVDASGSIYITGAFQGTSDFDPGAGVFNLSSSSYPGIFVQKMSQPPVGIAETNNTNQLSVYPNPSNGLFNIIFFSTGNDIQCNVEIFNSIGALVYNKQTSEEQMTIELTNQDNGIYFIKVMNNDNIIATKKVIKK